MAGPLAGFSLGLVLLLSGFILPPGDGIGLIVDASVFHESLLVGGIGKRICSACLACNKYLLHFFSSKGGPNTDICFSCMYYHIAREIRD